MKTKAEANADKDAAEIATSPSASASVSASRRPEGGMIQLRIRTLAEARGLTLAALQREAKLPVTTARRYWHSARSGLEKDAGTLTEVNLATLAQIAAVLHVRPGDLLDGE